MPILSDLDLSDNIKVFVYGKSGVGKTVFAAGFPGPIFYADFDGKLSSAASYYKQKNPDQLKQIEYESFTFDARQGGLKVFDTFRKKLMQLEELAKAGKFPYKTVVLDSLTTFSEAMLAAVMKSNPGIKRIDPETASMQDYLILNSQFKQMLSRFLALPCNIVMIGHIQQDKDENTGEIHYRPQLSGKLPERIPMLFTEVYHAFTVRKDGEVKRALQTSSDGRYVAKTQCLSMPEFVPMNYQELSKYMKGEVNAN